MSSGYSICPHIHVLHAGLFPAHVISVIVDLLYMATFVDLFYVKICLFSLELLFFL